MDLMIRDTWYLLRNFSNGQPTWLHHLKPVSRRPSAVSAHFLLPASKLSSSFANNARRRPTSVRVNADFHHLCCFNPTFLFVSLLLRVFSEKNHRRMNTRHIDLLNRTYLFGYFSNSSWSCIETCFVKNHNRNELYESGHAYEVFIQRIFLPSLSFRDPKSLQQSLFHAGYATVQFSWHLFCKQVVLSCFCMYQ